MVLNHGISSATLISCTLKIVTDKSRWIFWLIPQKSYVNQKKPIFGLKKSVFGLKKSVFWFLKLVFGFKNHVYSYWKN